MSTLSLTKYYQNTYDNKTDDIKSNSILNVNVVNGLKDYLAVKK